jgi:hypothetical protein
VAKILTRDGVLVYAAAILVGVAAMLLVMPVDALQGVGPGWNPPGPDQAQALTGHLAFQADQWRWPLLNTTRLFWPHGISLALVDSNALVSILAKLWTHATGRGPVNWLAPFLGACWLLQPVAAAYAARGLRVGAVGTLAAAVMAAAWPALMFRVMHINLCGHFLILLALGMTFRRIGLLPVPNRGMSALAGSNRVPTTRDDGGWETAKAWLPPAVLLLVSILTHPYLFQLCAAVLAAVPLQAALRRAGWQRDLGGYLLSGVLAVGVLVLFAGPLGGGDKGFTFFSMNLGSPVWPQVSGVFGKDLPILDGTGGQYEGFNWLGAGTLLLLLATVVGASVRRAWPRPALGLVIILAGLALLSLSSRVYAGHVKLIDLGDKPWEDIFGSFRSSGRAFWPVGYALMLGGVAAVDRLPRRVGTVLLLAAVALQLVDIQPLLNRTRESWVYGSGVMAPAVPGGTLMFTVAPHPGCASDLPSKWSGPIMLLDAVRHGAQLGDIGLGRPPQWFSCEAVTSDALDLPLLPHETRAFVGASIQTMLRPVLMGPGAVCRRAPDLPAAGTPGAPPFGAPSVVFCGRDVAEFPGTLLPAAPVPPPVPLPLEVGSGDLRGLLAFGWRLGMTGGAWSEGPRSVLLIPVKPGQRLELKLRASGISFRPGESRQVAVTAGRLPVGQFNLPDGLVTEVTVAIPASTIEDGILRIALNVVRPVDPARRGLAAPVHRAAILLSGLSLKVETGPAQ